LEKIESFKVNHNTLERGIYISRIDGDITTYDIRMKKPNGGNYLENPAMHTIEHLFATYTRNSEMKESIIYFGPMGCRTGFYFLVRNAEHDKVIKLIKETFSFISSFNEEIPGVSQIECGNYLEHSLEKARSEAKDILPILYNYSVEDLKYV